MDEEKKARAKKNWEAEQRHERHSKIVRWSFGLPLLFLGFYVLVIGPYLMCLGAILIAPEIAGFFANKFVNLIWPHVRSDPKPMYSIAESLVAKGDYEKAEQEYEKIIEEFPNEAKPHIDMINIASTRLHDSELALKLYQRGMTMLIDPKEKSKLAEMYRALSSRIKTEESERRQPIARTRRVNMNHDAGEDNVG
ncbi:hypothetical protein BVX94_01855 [bacterium B17]|nr:hypothetical protein BVX94_01855 [bacterium B17]